MACHHDQVADDSTDSAAFDLMAGLISSHMLSEIELIADDIGILNHGRLLFEGSLDNVRQNAMQSGVAADKLEDMFLTMVEKDNAGRKQRAI